MTTYAPRLLACLLTISVLPSSAQLHGEYAVCGSVGLEGFLLEQGVSIGPGGVTPVDGGWFIVKDLPDEAQAGARWDDGCVTAYYSVGEPRNSAGQADNDRDGMGDDWTATWFQRVGVLLQPLIDSDGDELLNVDEFRWQHTPVCAAGFGNCLDHEGSLVDGTGGDDWADGAEVHYWNNPHNDALNPGAGVAVFDPDRLIDTDGDSVSNVNDTDSDDDGLLDGEEYHAYGTYPEYPDSDCDAAATQCKPSWETRFYDAKPDGPGTGDLLDDEAELAYWTTINGLTTDYDGDGIASNLLDADSDDDTLVDGEEITVWNTKPYLLDSDLDGLDDGREVRVHRTDPADWDSDNDGMPDGWEVDGNLNPLANDAGLDPDADGLSNVGEYRYARPGAWSESTQGPWGGGTNPSDADTEGDALLDGDEVLTHETDPHQWDSDADGMADFFEVTHGLDPLDSADAGNDPDADSFDQGNDGSIEMAWPNVAEYQYGRTAWNEVELGPWRFGTDPLNPDTDGDSAKDGQEAFFGTDARVPAELSADDDGDGLSWEEEASLGTNPSDADSDGDGLCDGSRGSNCRFPGMGQQGNMPGEQDYGAIPWDADSDSDGRSDSQEALAWDPGASGSAQDVDGDLLNGVIDSDSDNDGLTDGDEFARTTDMSLADTDADGLTDGDEVAQYGTDPKALDTDADGLFDGDEVEVHHTRPTWWDTDGDGLNDQQEVIVHRTDPFWWDTDHDQLPDLWEVSMGTSALSDDARVDLDGDELSNLEEYGYGSNPTRLDTDADTLPDGYEVRNALSPAWAPDGALDADGDNLSNAEEFQQGTLLRQADSDADGLLDGDEVRNLKGQERGTLPLVFDTDGDHLGDGQEIVGTSITIRRSTGTTTYVATSDPLVLDTDGDGGEDGAELTQWKTDPRKADTDHDNLQDTKEAVQYQGSYSPVNWDTDSDGQSDGFEVASSCKTCDDDRDGLSNAEETSTYGTGIFDGDSDNDGLCDGSERNYWGTRWNVDSDGDGVVNLRDGDSDGDGLIDGVEVGQGAHPTAAGGYKTDPANQDSDGDTLSDGVEERLVQDATCPLNSDTSSASSSQSSQTFGTDPLAGAALRGIAGVGLGPIVILDAAIPLPSLAWNQVVPDARGVLLGHDEQGPYVLGAFGVRLRGVSMPDGSVIGSSANVQAAAEPCPKGKPTLANSDGGHGVSDGLSDNTENQYCLDPQNGDTDRDGLVDHVDANWQWSQDTDGDGLINSRDADSDGDGVPDGAEDRNRNGWRDSGELSALDADLDDDGILDANEARHNTLTDVADTDMDGLSDGLEVGLRSPEVDAVGRTWTDLSSPLLQCGGTWIRKTFQPFMGTTGFTTNPRDGDSENDGIIDGLEDLNQNGVFGLASEDEMDPTKADTDADGLADGLELLIWGPPQKDTPYGLCQVFEAWGDESSWASHMQHDPSNPLQTNPRMKHTDSDGVEDGLDVNPLGDVKFDLNLGMFYMLDRVDEGPGKAHAPDVKFFLEFKLPTGNQFTVSTVELDFPNSRNGFDLNTDLNSYTEGGGDFIAGSSGPAGVGPLAWTAGKIALDLFEAVDKFPTGSDCPDAICIKFKMIDVDVTNEQDIDLYPGAGTHYGSDGNRWAFKFNANPCQINGSLLEMNGQGDGIYTPNGKLAIDGLSTVNKHFLDNARLNLGAVGPATPMGRGLDTVTLGEVCS